ncbi:GGDEF domain-containing protein [Dehalobacter sp. DCM]|uniref:sensor domain-containing diguanylate cyclase n=1 Tax=Dehalobacter sp. DCM TaxID=2907827 RepID=UPI0030819744|nr:GGDEF domain-containing protein [Dehalobacter sp. DCM]
MKNLINLIEQSEIFLMRRTLEYAKLHNYTKYTSTLEEAWRTSISGLSEALTNALKSYSCIPELNVDEDYANDQIAAFGLLEAQRHRNRGITLEMFLGLMKYYRQSYLDLLTESYSEHNVDRDYFIAFINRFFDRVEVAFCSEWTRETKETLMMNLQNTNRLMTNEKNKYLTIFESIPTPAIILDKDNRVDNMNKAAQGFLRDAGITGATYYSNHKNSQGLEQILPWLVEEFTIFIHGHDTEVCIEKNLELPRSETRNLVIRFHRMLDVSEKYKGTVIIFTDFTDRKKIEDRLKYISFHDDLTGVYNRAFFNEELLRIGSGRFNPVAIIECDVDGLKVVNDTLGHQAGDVLISVTAEILRRSVRQSDVVARVGGDEFAIILPCSPSDSLKVVCEKIKIELAKHNKQNPFMPVSFSIGAALGDAHPGNVDEIYRNADKEMYQNKQENRQRFDVLFRSLYAENRDNLYKWPAKE